MKYLFLALLCFPLLIHAEKIPVLVSIAPYKSICEELGGDLVEVSILVPQGADSHNFEPTLQQVLKAQKAKIWFCIGEPFEAKLSVSLQETKKVDLRQNLNTLSDHDHPGGVDPHIWMSTTLMIEQAKTIAENLKELCPFQVATIDKNEQKIIEKLTALHTKIEKILEGKKGKTIFSAHAAYNYFCNDYGLKVQTIEKEGKDPSTKEVERLIDEARHLKITTIFIQSPSGHKGAQLVADAIGAKLEYLNPYNPDYFSMMETIANSFFKEARP